MDFNSYSTALFPSFDFLLLYYCSRCDANFLIIYAYFIIALFLLFICSVEGFRLSLSCPCWQGMTGRGTKQLIILLYLLLQRDRKLSERFNGQFIMNTFAISSRKTKRGKKKVVGNSDKGRRGENGKHKLNKINIMMQLHYLVCTICAVGDL